MTGLAACVAASEALSGLRSILPSPRHGSAPNDAVESATGWFLTQERSALEACERTLVAPLSDLSPVEMVGHIVAALMLVVQSEAPFGHRVSSPPYKRGTSVDVPADLTWLIGTAMDVRDSSEVRQVMRERLLAECMGERT
ncbi:MAG: hypothetical protein H3C58_16020 [Fimbriimonadaceae bacterium]|nr:hypothetical protein [Fimbriimonadaceae bacterium]